MSNNIVLYFQEASKERIDSWNQLILELNSIFDSVTCVLSPNVSDDASILFSDYSVTRRERNIKHLFLSKGGVDIDNDFPEFLFLTKHPEILKNIRLFRYVPRLLLAPVLKIIISKKISFIQDVILKSQATHLMVMEPKNFLYSASVVALELMCKRNNVSFNFVHGSFFINNIRVFDNLNRHEKFLYDLYKKTELTRAQAIKVEGFMEKYKKFLFYELSAHLTKMRFNANRLKYSDLYSEPYILFLDSKPGNYRTFYVNPDWRQSNVVNFVKYIPSHYKLVYKVHPKGINKSLIRKLKKRKVRVVNNSYDSYDLISGARLVLTNVSHSFVDAMILGKKVVILGDFNYLFAYDEGPFIRAASLEYLGEHIHAILAQKADISGVKKLFHLIIDSIKDDYFDFDKTVERFNCTGKLFDDRKMISMIVDYYNQILIG